MPTPQPGDIFSVPLSPGDLAFGRVMLNVHEQCARAGESVLLSLPTGVLLVEFYRETSRGELPESRSVLIPGMLTSGGAIERGEWKTVGQETVDPKSVAFPEYLAIDSISKSKFGQGEVVCPVNIPMAEVQSIDISLQTVPGMILPELILYQLDRSAEIDNPRLTDVHVLSLSRFDLRFSEHRAKVFESLDLDPDQTYYERAKSLGLDLARFYSN